jgi:sugar phosphate isomerase/epimerase
MIFWWRENNLSFEQECQFLKSNGFGIELWPSIKGQDECRYERRNWPRLLAATEGMLVSMRSAQSRNGGLGLDKWTEQIECAKMLNANIVTDLRSLGVADGIDNFDYTKQVVDLAKDYGVKLCLETGRLREVKRVGERFDSIWYCLDTGYAHLDSENSFKEYVDHIAPRVAHLHLADNYGQTDDHEPPGLKGGIARENWQYLLEALRKYDRDVIGALEMNPCMPGVMLRQATEFLFDELKWPNQPPKKPEDAFAAYNPT